MNMIEQVRSFAKNRGDETTVTFINELIKIKKETNACETMVRVEVFDWNGNHSHNVSFKSMTKMYDKRKIYKEVRSRVNGKGKLLYVEMINSNEMNSERILLFER